MHALLLLTRDLLKLKRGPQDIPYSVPLLATLIALDTSLDLAIATLLAKNEDILQILQRSLLSKAIPFVFLYAVLGLRNLRARFVQTASALVVVGITFTLLAVPLMLLMGSPPKSPQELTLLHGLISLAGLFLLAWSLSAHAHIFRHALNLPFALGFVVAIVWMMVVTVSGGSGSNGTT